MRVPDNKPVTRSSDAAFLDAEVDGLDAVTAGSDAVGIVGTVPVEVVCQTILCVGP